MKEELSILPSAARIATPPVVDRVAPKAIGAILIIDVTDVAGGGSITVTLQGKAPTANKYFTVGNCTLGAINANGTTIMKVYPGLPAVAPVKGAQSSCSDILPDSYRVNIVHLDGNSITYSVELILINGE